MLVRMFFIFFGEVLYVCFTICVPYDFSTQDGKVMEPGQNKN